MSKMHAGAESTRAAVKPVPAATCHSTMDAGSDVGVGGRRLENEETGEDGRGRIEVAGAE